MNTQVTKATVLLAEGLLHDAVATGQWKDPAQAAQYALGAAIAFDALAEEGLQATRAAQAQNDQQAQASALADAQAAKRKLARRKPAH